MNRSTLALPAAAVVAAAIVGISAAGTPASAPSVHGGHAERVPVRHTDVVCPASAIGGDTPDVSAFAPGPVSGGASGGSTRLGSAAGPSAPGASSSLTPKKDAPALTASGDGALAPGFAVQQTTERSSGTGRGLSGLDCPRPDASFWFAGASLAGSRTDTVTVVNTGTEAATVDVDLYGTSGPIEADAGKGLPIQPGKTVKLPLKKLASSKDRDVAVHVVSRSSRVSAALQSVDGKDGSDWLPNAADGTKLTVPGIPKDAKDARLVVANPGPVDTTLNVRVAGKSSSLSPAGHDTVDVPGGGIAAVDLGDITHGEAAGLTLSPAAGAPAVDVAAGLRLTRKSGSGSDAAFVGSTGPVGTRADSAGNLDGKSTLLLTADPGKQPAKVSISAAGGGAAKTVEIPGGTTRTLPVPAPGGAAKGKPYGITVRTVGTVPVHAARMLDEKVSGVPMFTVQPLADDHGEVLRPVSRQDDSVLFDH